MAGRAACDGDTFFPVVFYTRLEYGGSWDSVHSYRGGGLYFAAVPMTVICIADAAAKMICGAYLLFFAKPSRFVLEDKQR